jgi:D-threonate/D-erythronate kinase
MITVIADDFTGAAEIAGIGLRYDLTVELTIGRLEDIKKDMLVLCTDSRSMSKKDAEKITADTIKKVWSLKPELIYKKIDSVFRGHILDEVKIEMKITGLDKALIVGANPSLGRTIKDGKYFIQGKPINETGFANDPEFAITESSVLKMLKAKADEAQILQPTDKLPDTGIVIGEAISEKDMIAWANKVNDSWLLVGAGDFFTALLNRKFTAQAQPGMSIEWPHLYVSGTAFNKSQEFISDVDSKTGCVAYLPISMMQSANFADKEWLDTVSKIIQSQKKVIIAINKNEKIPPGISAQSLRTTMAKAIGQIVERNEIKEIFIEGGSTAGAILDELKITTLLPVNEISRGVVKMKAKGWHITVKPGSYELPEQIMKLYKQV